MNKISMQTRDQWYKPNLLYNIHWRPPKEPETHAKMIVETVQFNPSVCTCGQHDSQPRYRMEKRVLWSAKDIPIYKQKIEKESGELTKSKKNDYEFDKRENARRDKEGANYHADKTEADDGDIKGDGKQSVGNTLDSDEEGDREKSGRYKNVGGNDNRENSDNMSKHGKKHGSGENISGSRFNCVERPGDGEREEYCSDSENGKGLKKGGEKHSGSENNGDGKCDNLKTGDRTRDDRGSDEEDGNGLKTNGIKHCDGLKTNGIKYGDGFKTNGIKYGNGLKTDGIKYGCGLKTDGITYDGGLNIGGSKSDDARRTGRGIEGKEVSNNVNSDKGDRSKIDDRRQRIIDGSVSEVHTENDGTEINACVSCIINDGCDREAADDVMHSEDADDTIFGDRKENHLVKEEYENHEAWDDDISPAFGILSIYCNSEIHFAVSSSTTPSHT